MGCDIHVYLEKYTSVNGEYKWVNVDHWQLNPDFGSHENEREYDLIPFYWGRNYDLFSILAEVRGSYDPIDDPRGLPEDVTDATRKEFERWGRDAHTPSHYTLKELKDYLYNNSEDDELTDRATFRARQVARLGFQVLTDRVSTTGIERPHGLLPQKGSVLHRELVQ